MAVKKGLGRGLDSMIPEPKTKDEQKKEKTAVAKEEDKDLFEALRALRLSIIASNNAPAYTVFPDKTLHEMASRKPTTLTQMEQISGVGKKKIEQYGDIFMEKIREYLGITD